MSANPTGDQRNSKPSAPGYLRTTSKIPQEISPANNHANTEILIKILASKNTCLRRVSQRSQVIQSEARIALL